ncbi:hypothetical protein AMTR_s00150p00047480 [Amborella trichopoda]|uniref:Retrotransposon gag domain-containing protein n=1 Tax=Amborella trichopoda TaxID=13333 RepID=W1PEQ9_AMBTC|nr:hypothetical protein AMTR_s00150p00047480 [Amborella trichopoda]
MFKKFIMYHRANKPHSVSIKELVAIKQELDKAFIDYVNRFNGMPVRVMECPLSDHARIEMILENSNVEYNKLISNGGLPLSIHVMSERITLYEMTKSQTVGTMLIKRRESTSTQKE